MSWQLLLTWLFCIAVAPRHFPFLKFGTCAEMILVGGIYGGIEGPSLGVRWAHRPGCRRPSRPSRCAQSCASCASCPRRAAGQPRPRCWPCWVPARCRAGPPPPPLSFPGSTACTRKAVRAHLGVQGSAAIDSLNFASLMLSPKQSLQPASAVTLGTASAPCPQAVLPGSVASPSTNILVALDRQQKL